MTILAYHLYLEALYELRGYRYGDEGTPIPFLQLLPEVYDPRLKHRPLLGAVPLDVLADLQASAFAYCGVLHVVQPSAEANSKLCQDCAVGEEVAEPIVADLRRMYLLIERLGDDVEWSFAHDVCAILAHLTSSPVQLVSEALDHAVRGRSTQGTELSIRCVLWSQVWMHKLLVAEGSTARAQEFELLVAEELRRSGLTGGAEAAEILNHLAENWHALDGNATGQTSPNSSPDFGGSR